MVFSLRCEQITCGSSDITTDTEDISEEHKRLRLELHKRLGIDESWDSTAYLNYIDKLWNVKGIEPNENLALFISLIRYFHDFELVDLNGEVVPTPLGLGRVGEIQTYINFISSWETSLLSKFFHNTAPNSDDRRMLVKDTVMWMLGAWTAMLSYFIRQPDHRPIEQAYWQARGYPARLDTDQTTPMTLQELLEKNCLIPCKSRRSSVSWFSSSLSPCKSNQGAVAWDPYRNGDLLNDPWIGDPESAIIPADKLNAYTLLNLGGAKIFWTMNICRHLLCSQRGGRPALEVFALPIVTQSTYPKGVDQAYLDEIALSYPILFRPFGKNPHEKGVHKLFGRVTWCCCKRCFAERLRRQSIEKLKRQMRSSPLAPAEVSECKDAYDPTIEHLIEAGNGGWTADTFPCLWPRIRKLQEFQDAAKPWSVWILFRDRRDTAQYWGFLLGTIMFALAILEIFLSVAQTVGTFHRR